MSFDQSSSRRGSAEVIAALTATLTTGVVLADPCGMVPPFTVEGPAPIARVGYQQTYVFYKDGVETFVIHPGFSGKVEEFGMLIPFPAVPEIRKVSNKVFPHLAAAVDPPEVVVDLRPRPQPRASSRFQGYVPDALDSGGGLKLRAAQVRVLKQEAVGMYQVAVLEAGSSAALKKWMDEKGYRYPDGMDKACEDYVQEGWCFVAVKTKVAGKKGIDPQPGQRKIIPRLPDGSTFDGHVQAMGFRFKVKEMVVPMRLSTFNEGDLHNIVYILSDKPMKVNSIPEEFVVRQISGKELYRNLTSALPLRVIGGTKDQIPFNTWGGGVTQTDMEQLRDPTPHNGVAKHLIAGDILSMKTGRLSHPHEEAEKMLLMIDERFGLRGAEIDKLSKKHIEFERRKIVYKALDYLKLNRLTLTVVDGNFPREVLANQNLHFSPYKMPAPRNKPEFYNATKHGPSPKQPGVRYHKSVRFDAPANKTKVEAISQQQPVRFSSRILFLTTLASCLSLGLGWFLRRRGPFSQ